MTDKYKRLRAIASIVSPEVIKTTSCGDVSTWRADLTTTKAAFIEVATPAAILDLLAERDALAAENAAMRAELEAVGAGGVQRLREEGERDAVRLDFLDKTKDGAISLLSVSQKQTERTIIFWDTAQCHESIEGIAGHPVPTNVRAAIDAAMAKLEATNPSKEGMD